MPQLVGSMRVSAQPAVAPVPQRVSGAAHESAHAPIEQTLPVGHTRPHMPQLALSVCVETHVPAHTVWPIGHEKRHAPSAQI
jgi:hypothetical protein